MTEEVSGQTIDEAHWLLEDIAALDNLASDANACKIIISTIGVVIICPPRPRSYNCRIEPYCMEIWEWRR